MNASPEMHLHQFPGLPFPPSRPTEPVASAHFVQPLPATAARKPGLAERRWPWTLLSVLLHGLALAAALLWSASESPRPDEPLLVIGTVDLAGLGGGGGAGDGREAGDSGGGPRPAAAEAGTPSPPPPQPQAPETPAPPAPPAPSPLASSETPAPPKPVARPKPKRAARPAGTATAAREVAGVSPSPVAAPAPAGAAGEGNGTGTGISGHGPGRGQGEGPGQGGTGKGTGGGAGDGDYEGRFGQGDGPRFRHRCLPRYPDEAKNAGKEGAVSLRLRIDAEGVLRDVSVTGHSGLDFVEEALRAIKASTFHPAVRHGRPIPCSAVLTIRFKLG